MAGVVLKYSASVYQEKIGSLQSLKARLQTNLENLENLHQQVDTFWHDDASANYIIAIANAIVKVRKAQQDVDGLSAVYQDAVDQLTRLDGAVDQTVENVQSAVEKSIDVAAKIGPIIAGL